MNGALMELGELGRNAHDLHSVPCTCELVGVSTRVVDELQSFLDGVNMEASRIPTQRRSVLAQENDSLSVHL